MPDRQRFISIKVNAEPCDESAGGRAAAGPEDPPQPPRARAAAHPTATSGAADLADRSALRRTAIRTAPRRYIHPIIR